MPGPAVSFPRQPPLTVPAASSKMSLSEIFGLFRGLRNRQLTDLMVNSLVRNREIIYSPVISGAADRAGNEEEFIHDPCG